MSAEQLVMVDTFTDGVLDPAGKMAGPVQNGGRIVINTAPGCWGPMLTPQLKGGHEVCQPIQVEGAHPGDAVAVTIEAVRITSKATASGSDEAMEGRFDEDAFVQAKCPNCGTVHPETEIKGIGEHAIRCKVCGAEANPFRFREGYTMVFDEERKIGVTVGKKAAEEIAENGRYYMQTPQNSVQNPVVTLAGHTIPGVAARTRAFIGQLGTVPKRPMPDSHNAGDFGQFLVGAHHAYGQTQESLVDKTDGHMDINKVREGAVVLCPVKAEGAGVYAGDVHAMQGEGEIAGHTTDVSAVVILKVEIIRDLHLDGPVILPVKEDIPYLARPLTEEEKRLAQKEAMAWGIEEIEESYPLSFVGTGADMNTAVDNGVKHAAEVLDMTEAEVLNRVTITGAVEIGRTPGVCTVTFRVPKRILEKKNIWDFVERQYRF